MLRVFDEIAYLKNSFIKKGKKKYVKQYFLPQFTFFSQVRYKNTPDDYSRVNDSLTIRMLFRCGTINRVRLSASLTPSFLKSSLRKPDVEEMIQRQADAIINATVRFESTLTRFMIGLNFKRKLSTNDGLRA